MRRLLRFVILAALALAGIVAYRRRFAARRERIDLYYEDGSLVSLDEASDEALRLLPLAHDVIRAARS